MLNDYYRNFFSSGVNNILRQIQNDISLRRTSSPVGNESIEDYTKAMQIYPFENPLDYCVFLNENGNSIVSGIELYYHDYDDNLFYEKINEIQEVLQKKIGYNSSQYDIAKTIYDYITSNMDYNHDALKESSNVDTSNKEDVRNYNSKYGSCFTIYGPVVNKEGVCAGLCQLYKYLLNLFGVEAVCVAGFYKKDGEATQMGHSVVVVEIDGEYAYVDVASGMRNGTNLKITLYDYFLVSEDKIFDIFQPLYEEYQFETTDKLSYFAKNDLQFESINDICSYLNKIILFEKNNLIYFEYSGHIASKKQLEKIVYDIVSKKKGYQYQYNFVERNGIISMKIYQERRGTKNER